MNRKWYYIVFAAFSECLPPIRICSLDALYIIVLILVTSNLTGLVNLLFLHLCKWALPVTLFIYLFLVFNFSPSYIIGSFVSSQVAPLRLYQRV